jgi:hypothetical protein
MNLPGCVFCMQYYDMRTLRSQDDGYDKNSDSSTSNYLRYNENNNNNSNDDIAYEMKAFDFQQNQETEIFDSINTYSYRHYRKLYFGVLPSVAGTTGVDTNLGFCMNGWVADKVCPVQSYVFHTDLLALSPAVSLIIVLSFFAATLLIILVAKWIYFLYFQ